MIITKPNIHLIEVAIIRQVQDLVNKMLKHKNYYVNKQMHHSAYLHLLKPRTFAQILEPDLSKFEERVQSDAEEYVLSKYEKINIRECR